MAEREKQRQLEYARHREWQRLQQINRADAIAVRRLHDVMQHAFSEVQREAEAWYSRYATSEGISMSEAKKAAAQADIEELKRKAQYYVQNRRKKEIAFSDQANREMREYNFAMKVSRHELLMRHIELAMTNGAIESTEILGKHLINMSEAELIRQAGLLGLAVPRPEILRDQAEAIARSSFHDATFSERLWANQKTLTKQLQNGITRSIMMGKNPTTWARSLRTSMIDAQRLADYVTRRIAITESGRVQIEAQKVSYERSGYSQYVVICEPTACDICLEHDEATYPVNEMIIGVNAPMFHPFCKCSTSAHVDRSEVEDAFAEYEELAGIENVASEATNEELVKVEPESEPVSIVESLRTKKDVADFMKKDLGFTNVTTRNLDLQVLKDTATTIDKFYTEYPQLKGFIQQLKLNNQPNAVAAAELDWSVGKGSKTSLSLNPTLLKDTAGIKQMIDDHVRTGFWSPKAGTGDIINHELTHLLEYQQSFKRLNVNPFSTDVNDVLAQHMAINNIRQGAFSREVTETAFNNLGLPFDSATIAAEVSQYATYSTLELLAEAVGSSARNVTMDEIVRVLKDKLQ